MSIRSTSFRALVAPAVLLAGGLVGSSCTPPPACPTLAQGAWSGTWSSTAITGATGAIGGTFTTSGTTLGGELGVTGSFYVAPGPVTGTIACDHLTGARTDSSVTFEGTISPDGRTVTGTYDAATVSDSGTIVLRAG